MSGCTREGDVVTLPAVRVFCDILVHIKDILLEYICISHGQTYTKEDIKWVLTVPAMWRASARDVIRQAAKEVRSAVCASICNSFITVKLTCGCTHAHICLMLVSACERGMCYV